ncbi:MAG: deoxyribonuclease V [Chloroflexota bacterium]|nr:deoxyribonuclease V [Dehalococcoidia bacterium]MDW8254771.1 deoxyribonuclease V [Chloroflexota bacterium]
MRVLDLHPWEVSPREAAAIQRRLRDRLVIANGPLLADLRLVAGADTAYRREGRMTVAYSVVVVLRFPELDVVETRRARLPVAFPYVPGLLAFREAPAILAAFRQVERVPDVVLVDGHGYAHPRRLGLASHLGLLLDVPTIGCAKSRLVGHAADPPNERGAVSLLVDRGEVVGAAVRTQAGHAPLYVSPGHRIGVERAIEIALACCRDAFLPEPTRRADAIVNRAARRDRAAEQGSGCREHSTGEPAT